MSGRSPSRRPIRAWVVLALLLLGAGAAPPADAQGREATSEEVSDLAAEAVTDDGALADLREVEAIDGVPVDMGSATAGIDDDPQARSVRLDELAGSLGQSTLPTMDSDPSVARDSAAEVLEDRKYRPTDLPRPLAGPLEWLADRIRPLGDAWESVTAAVLRAADRVPGGRFLLLLAVVGGAAASAAWLAGRRSRAAVERERTSTLVDLALDPASLEAEAGRAEEAGDHATAVRRRYEAGLLRLVSGGRLDLTPATTAAGAAAQVDRPAMDEATAAFQEIVYGGRSATAADSDRSRRLWSDLLGAEVRR